MTLPAPTRPAESKEGNPGQDSEPPDTDLTNLIFCVLNRGRKHRGRIVV